MHVYSGMSSPQSSANYRQLFFKHHRIAVEPRNPGKITNNLLQGTKMEVHSQLLLKNEMTPSNVPTWSGLDVVGFAPCLRMSIGEHLGYPDEHLLTRRDLTRLRTLGLFYLGSLILSLI